MRTILLLLCAFLPYSLLAQDDSVICGRVMNKDSEPVAYATISILSESGEYIKSTISIEDGSFELPLSLSSICVLRISHQSYDDLTLKLNLSSNHKLEPILLNRRADVLTEAAIVADRKVIRRKADMVIFSPKYVVGANNAMDLLKRSSGVLVQGGKITMFGAGEAKIYIDGREQKANAEQLAGILQMYSAEDVETIELIHTPSAKYSASGSSGVINIVTKKKYSDFLGGNVSVSHSQNNKLRISLSCRNLLASKIRGVAESNNGYNMVFENIYNHRTIVFSANWSWGGNHRLNRRNDNTQDFKDRLVDID